MFETRGVPGELYQNNYGNYSWEDRGNHDEITVYTHYGEEGVVAWDEGSGVRDMSTAYLTIDFPLVRAESWSEAKYVPVTLLYDAVEYLQKTLMAAKKRTYYLLYDVTVTPNRLIKDFGIVHPEVTYGELWKKQWKVQDGIVELKKVDSISARWKTLNEKLSKKGAIFYVKPAAFRWFPVDVSHAVDAQGTKLTDTVNARKEELERAKKLLLLAGGAAILT